MNKQINKKNTKTTTSKTVGDLAHTQYVYKIIEEKDRRIKLGGTISLKLKKLNSLNTS